MSVVLRSLPRAFFAVACLVARPAFAPDADNVAPPTAATFQAQAEFPNLFLPREYWKTSPALIPTAVAEAARAKAAKLLKHVFDRVEVPIANPADPTGAPKRVRYFSHLQSELRAIDPTIEVIPSGGVIRATMTHLYARAFENMRRGISPDDTFKEILAETKGVPYSDVQGVASDFDVLLKGNAEKFPAAREKALAVSSSFQSGLGTTYQRFDGTFTGASKSFFFVGDFKPFDGPNSQLDRSARQGGALSDLLAFDLAKGEFVDSKRFPDASLRVVKGEAVFAPAQDANSVEDAGANTVRGVRALLEMPWLTFPDAAAEATFRGQVEKLTLALGRGEKVLSEKAVEQFQKMLRNAFAGGANNRFHRAGKDSLDALILQFAKAVQKSYGGFVLPQLVERLPVGRPVADKPPLLPGHSMMPVDAATHAALLKDLSTSFLGAEEFKKTHTRDGYLFHGTPSTATALSILRENLFLSLQGHQASSRPGQGTAIYGRGAYFSPHRATARDYAGKDGSVVRLPIDFSKPLRILDYPAFIKTEAGKKLFALLNGDKDRIHELLAQSYGVDIIVDGHVLVQTTEALRFPHGEERWPFLLEAYADQVRNVETLARIRYDAFQSLQELTRMAASLGHKVPVDLPTGTELLKSLREIYNKTPTAEARADIVGPWAELHRSLGLVDVPYEFIQALANPDRKLRELAADHVAQFLPADRSKRREFLESRRMLERLSQANHKADFPKLLVDASDATDTPRIHEWFKNASLATRSRIAEAVIESNKFTQASMRKLPLTTRLELALGQDRVLRNRNGVVADRRRVMEPWIYTTFAITEAQLTAYDRLRGSWMDGQTFSEARRELGIDFKDLADLPAERHSEILRGVYLDPAGKKLLGPGAWNEQFLAVRKRLFEEFSRVPYRPLVHYDVNYPHRLLELPLYPMTDAEAAAILKNHAKEPGAAHWLAGTFGDSADFGPPPTADDGRFHWNEARWPAVIQSLAELKNAAPPVQREALYLYSNLDSATIAQHADAIGAFPVEAWDKVFASKASGGLVDKGTMARLERMMATVPVPFLAALEAEVGKGTRSRLADGELEDLIKRLVDRESNRAHRFRLLRLLYDRSRAPDSRVSPSVVLNAILEHPPGPNTSASERAHIAALIEGFLDAQHEARSDQVLRRKYGVVLVALGSNDYAAARAAYYAYDHGKPEGRAALLEMAAHNPAAAKHFLEWAAGDETLTAEIKAAAARGPTPGMAPRERLPHCRENTAHFGR